MATKQNTQAISLVAAADLSAAQYHFVTINSSGLAALTGAGLQAAGVMQDNPIAGQVGAVDIAGVTKVEAAGAITIGARVASNSTGEAVAATTGDYALGTAMDTGADGRIIAILLQPTGIEA